MAVSLGHRQFERWREFIYGRTGILLGADKAYLVEHRLAPLLEPGDQDDLGRLLLRVRDAPTSHPLCQRVIDAITTHETSWFREPKIFGLLRDSILPRLHRDIHHQRRGPVRIWSAACSTGQEPYSVAMTALEAYRHLGGREVCHQEVAILASDISQRSLQLARRAHYDRAAVARGLDDYYLRNYFTPRGSGWQVQDEVRAMVEFRQLNLRDSLAQVGVCDLVLLRNTIIYFSDEFKRGLFRRLPAVMSRGALLFLGTGETAGHYTDAFEIIDEAGLVYYRLVDHPGHAA